jgi:hypothetical protein
VLEVAPAFINSMGFKVVPIHKQCKSERVKNAFNCKETLEIVRLLKDLY